ncbi:hypothetical protein C2G38_2211534 [Gigaspora rosea]|uniref:Uncharacterized protein n=1 Tax=Gigaspora rosea TaxID=44941 RepID=A0A397UM98_9GLOM|nr:hypothetical protein C2G38_2211534 [Gigaspora rosea]
MVNKDKAFKYRQEAADIRNINRIYSIGYCYQNEFGIEEDEHQAFEYYKKLTIAIKEVTKAFDLDPIEDKCSKKKTMKNNWLIRDQIVRISLVKNVKNRIGENDSNGIVYF